MRPFRAARRRPCPRRGHARRAPGTHGHFHRTGGHVSCARLTPAGRSAPRSGRCSPRSCGRSPAAARCGRCCSCSARSSATASFRRSRSMARQA
ncbi:MAG: hypothetical protein E6G88_12935, partial [Alphaproteobacteria bacterium]